MEERETVPKKAPMSDEERVALGKKLDEDLDNFMDDMASKQKAEGKQRKPFDFDEWCKDLDNHPAFMKSIQPDENGELPEAVQALQALKYEDGENHEENAESNKEEGNKHFKWKKYRWATDCYTNGIKQLCTDRALNSVLFANRAAAQVRLGNLRSATRDCVFARRFDATNLKAVVRCAECLLKLGYGKQCIEWIDSCIKLLDESLTHAAEGKEMRRDEQLKRLNELKAEAVQSALIEERDARKGKAVEAKELKVKTALLSAFAQRKLHFKPLIHFDEPSLFEWHQIEVNLPQTKQHEQVYLNSDGVLCWPLLIQYPEPGQTDFFSDCAETSKLQDLLQPIFENQAQWDHSHQFRQENVRVFVSLDSDDSEVYEVLMTETLGHVLSTERFLIVQGLPVLQVYTKRRAEEHFEKFSSRTFRPK